MSEYTVYSKRNCSYCVRAIELLESKGLTHDVKKIDEDQNLFLELRQRAPSMRTMPVISVSYTHLTLPTKRIV